jgi:hypothetical protein
MGLKGYVSGGDGLDFCDVETTPLIRDEDGWFASEAGMFAPRAENTLRVRARR